VAHKSARKPVFLLGAIHTNGHEVKNDNRNNETSSFGRFFVGVLDWQENMAEKNKYLKARIKFQKEIAKVYPPAESWRKPIGPERPFP
jgi:hypothetical protein